MENRDKTSSAASSSSFFFLLAFCAVIDVLSAGSFHSITRWHSFFLLLSLGAVLLTTARGGARGDGGGRTVAAVD